MSFLINSPYVKGVLSAVPVFNARKVENTFRQGQNHFYTGLLQGSQVLLAFQNIALAFKKIYNTSLFKSWTAFGLRLGVTCVPLALAYKAFVDSHTKDSARKMGPFERKVTYLIIDNIGHLTTLASVVSSVALVAFGYYALGGASLATLGIGFFVERGHFPYRFRQIFYKLLGPANALAMLVSPSFTNKIFGAADIGMVLYRRFTGTGAVVLENQVSLANYQVSDISKGLNPYGVPKPAIFMSLNKDHLEKAILPLDVPNVSYDDLEGLVDSITWTPSLTKILMTKLEDDQRWSQRVNKSDSKEGKAYFKKCFKDFLDRVKNKAILAGQPMSYDAFEIYLKHTIVMLKDLKKKDPDQVSLILLQLGIEGIYCGPGIFRVVEEVFLSLLSHHGKLNFRQRIYLVLQLARLRIFQDFYKFATDQMTNKQRMPELKDLLNLEPKLPPNPGFGDYLNWMIAKVKGKVRDLNSVVYDSEDVHLYNAFLHIIGRSFGLPTLSSDNDQTIGHDGLSEEVCIKAREVIQPFLLQKYREKIVNEVYEAWGTPILPAVEGDEELMDWVSGRDPSLSKNDKQGAYMLEIGNLISTSVPGGNTQVKLKKKMIPFFLADIGVFNLSL